MAFWPKNVRALDFGFWAPLLLQKNLNGQCCTYGLKTTLKLLVHVMAIMINYYQNGCHDFVPVVLAGFGEESIQTTGETRI